MAKPLVRLAVALSGGLLAVVVCVPAAFAETAKDLTFVDEAWFFRYRQPLAPAPDVPDPGGVNADEIAKAELRNRTNPYPPETLHVGVNSGEPEAELFLMHDLFALGEGVGAILTGGTVTFTDAGTTCHGPDWERTGRASSCGSRNVEAADKPAPSS